MTDTEFAVTPSWRRTADPYFPVAARVDGVWWVVRVNSFPEHPLWTLFVDGERRCDVDDAPAAWGDPASADHPSLRADETEDALAPIRGFVAYGSEVGEACDDPWCCG